jgi:hypothetical protein
MEPLSRKITDVLLQDEGYSESGAVVLTGKLMTLVTDWIEQVRQKFAKQPDDEDAEFEVMLGGDSPDFTLHMKPGDKFIFYPAEGPQKSSDTPDVFVPPPGTQTFTKKGPSMTKKTRRIAKEILKAINYQYRVVLKENTAHACEDRIEEIICNVLLFEETQLAPGEVWMRSGARECQSDETYTFAGEGFDLNGGAQFVFNRLNDGEIFVISKRQFTEEINLWSLVATSQNLIHR